MPYIKSDERTALDPIVRQLGEWCPADKPGKLVYVLYSYFLHYVPRCFFSFCVFFGAMVLTLFEVYRRIVSKYENDKVRENGDVC